MTTKDTAELIDRAVRKAWDDTEELVRFSSELKQSTAFVDYIARILIIQPPRSTQEITDFLNDLTLATCLGIVIGKEMAAVNSLEALFNADLEDDGGTAR